MPQGPNTSNHVPAGTGSTGGAAGGGSTTATAAAAAAGSGMPTDSQMQRAYAALGLPYLGNQPTANQNPLNRPPAPTTCM